MAGVQTGRASSAASAKRPDWTPNWKRAVPAISAAAGKRTSIRSLAGTVTRRPWPEVMAALVARSATSTFIAWSVWFWRTTGISNLSPKLRKRGGEGRTMSGMRAVMLASPEPNCFSPATTATITR